MGGSDGSSLFNDVWKSMDEGATWTEVTSNAGWSDRMGQSVVSTQGSYTATYVGSNNGNCKNITNPGQDFDIVIGNYRYKYFNRGDYNCTSNDGNIVLMGGYGISYKNDTWISANNGATWTQQNASSGWNARYLSTSVIMPDNSIIILGGDASGNTNDMWRSTDNGTTWVNVSNADWSARSWLTGVTLSDSSIVIMGGQDYDYKNDVWRLNPSSATTQNVVHVYNGTLLQKFDVSLQVYDDSGHNSIQKVDLITLGASPSVNFYATPLTGVAPLNVTFTDTSTNLPDVWAWNFGDSNTSTLQNPTHTYENPGNYTVSLIATNVFNTSALTKTDYIYVTSKGVTPRQSNTADIAPFIYIGIIILIGASVVTLIGRWLSKGE
jgi:hypothetical protein